MILPQCEKEDRSLLSLLGMASV